MHQMVQLISQFLYFYNAVVNTASMGVVSIHQHSVQTQSSQCVRHTAYQSINIPSKPKPLNALLTQRSNSSTLRQNPNLTICFSHIVSIHQHFVQTKTSQCIPHTTYQSISISSKPRPRNAFLTQRINPSAFRPNSNLAMHALHSVSSWLQQKSDAFENRWHIF